VIGAAVNEAARLCELAKQRGGAGILASGVAVEEASGVEAGNWELGGDVKLRGRTRATRFACPKD